MRPNLFGESQAPVALLLVFGAGAAAFIDDGGIRRSPNFWYFWRVPLWVAMAYVSVLAVELVNGQELDFIGWLKGITLALVTLSGVVVVLAQEDRRVLVGKLFVLVIVALSVSYIVTLAVWAVLGVGAGRLGEIFTGAGFRPWPFYFPFTPTIGIRALPFDITLPRFTGLGREPGWMAMYAAFTYFIAPRLGWRHWSIRAIIVVALLGTFSTAGFILFVVVVAVDRIVRVTPRMITTFRRLGTIARAGLVGLFVLCLVGVSWLLVKAPVFGLEAKLTEDRYSSGDRWSATLAGIKALFSTPLSGGNPAEVAPGLSIIASIAPYGVLFALCVILAFVMSGLSHESFKEAAAPVAIVFLTLLVAQPPLDSTWAYVCVLMALAVATPRMIPVLELGSAAR